MKVRCPGCKEFFDVPDGASRKAPCPTCGGQVLIEAAEKVSEADSKGDLLDELLLEIRKPEALHPLPIATGAAPPAAGWPEATPEAAERQSSPRKPKSHFPRRPSRVYGKKLSLLRSPTLAVILGILVLVGVGFLVVHFIIDGVRNQTARTALERANGQESSIRSRLETADQYRAEKDYNKALDAYGRVVTLTRPLLDRLRDSAADLKPGDLLEKINAADVTLAAYLKRAEDGRNADEVKYGAQGLVNFDGEWMTPENMQKMIDAKMKAEGRQLYEDEWLTQEEINQRKGLVEYNGHWVTKAEYERLRAQATTNTVTPPPKEVPKPPVPRPVNRLYPPDEKTWVLDDFDTAGHSWTPVRWDNANPCAIQRIGDTTSGQMKITLSGGEHDKSAIVRPLRLDFSNRSMLRMDIVNNCGEPLRVAIALQTNSYYETRWYQPQLKPGLNKNVSFDLKARDFKCAATRWIPSASVARLQQVAYLYILFYNQSGEVILDDIQALGGE